LAALCAGFLLLGRAAPARAQGDSVLVLVRVGNNISGRAGDYVDVPIIVDLSGAAGRMLGSYTATLTFSPMQLEFQGAGNGSFATPQTNTNHAADSGTVRLTAIQPSGASGAVVLFYARFYVLSDSGQSPVTISFSEMSATATSSPTPFESLLPLLKIVNGTFCKSLGRWGDVNGDGDANSLDALVALSVVVGIPVDTTVMKPALADVDGDGKVTSRDALIILSYAVGLPVTGYRVLLNAPGACGTGAPITIVISPDSLELQVGQSAGIVFAALDSLGRTVSTDSGTVTSSNPSVAAWVNTESGGIVQARAPGVAILTARLGPGVAATFKVVVLARRTKWYVDVQRASLAPAQLGDSVLPFEFIGDALNLAHNGDTVLVAGGTYEEEVSADVAVTILGDSTNRPVIDPRGAPSWNSSSYAVDLEPVGGQIVLANLVVRAGRTFLAAHDVTVRNVRIEGLGTNGYAALEMQTAQPYEDAPPARAAGPQRSDVPAEPGNALVDGVVVLADSINNGIVVAMADTAVIRNSAVRRAQQGPSPSCGAGPYTSSGILVQQASVSLAQNDSVINPQCQGIALFDDNSGTLVGDVSRATATHNVVISAPGTGIALGSRLVSSDHNVVSNTGRVPGQSSYGNAVGIVASYYEIPPDTVWSLGDNIVGSGGRGFAIDTAAKAVIDSLVVSGAGLDSSSYGEGVDLGAGGTYWLSHSRITNTVYSDGVYFTGEHTSLHSHGNYLSGAGRYGLSTYQYCDCAPPARGAPAPGGTAAPQQAGPYTGGPDTLISVSDTIRGSSSTGVYLQNGVYALVDSAAIDSSGQYGVYLYDFSRGTISHSSVSRGGSAGIYVQYVDTMTVLGDSVLSNGGDGLYVSNYGSLDSTRIIGSTFAANSANGVYLYYATARVDSSVMVNNGAGLYIDYGSGARVRWSRFQANNIGVWMGNVNTSSSVVNSNFLSDTTAGVVNNSDGHMLTADTNYWGDANGPICGLSVVGCSGSSVIGDSITTLNVTFANWLSTNAPTLSPPLHLAALAARPPKPARAALSGPAGASAAQVAPRSPLADRASRVAADAAAVAQRSQRQRPAAWHAPSKAKTHAVQIIVKKRT
jgi:hypothetical protein